MNKKIDRSSFTELITRLAAFKYTVILYLLLAVICLKYYQYQINPDGITYIGIAEMYMNGEFYRAISGAMAPLISWLLIPLLSLHIKPILAFKILSLIIGLLTLIGLKLLSYKLAISEQMRNLILCSSVPLIVWYAFCILTPDLLSACILIYYFNILFSDSYTANRRQALFAGVLGGIAYLSKNYIYPFFIAHFIGVNIWYYINAVGKDVRKNIVRNTLIGLMAFFVVTSGWVAAISKKYNRLTVCTAGSMAITAVRAGIYAWPEDVDGFDKHSLSVDDMLDEIDIEHYRQIKGAGALKNELNNITRNIIRFFMFYKYKPILIFSFIYIMLSILPITNNIFKDKLTLFIFTVLLYPCGYFILSMSDERYIWINDLVLLILSAYAFSEMLKSPFFTPSRKTATVLMVCMSIALPFTAKLFKYKNTGRNIYTLAAEVQKQYDLKDAVIAAQYENSDEI